MLSIYTKFELAVPLDKIEISDLNVRSLKDAHKDLEPLTESIRRRGLIHPIVLLPKDDRFEVVVGQRRYLAVKELGGKTIPALILSPVKAHEGKILSAMENLQRRELTFKDKVEAAEEEIRMMTTWHGLLHAINSNLDDICEKRYGEGVKVKVITEVNEQNMKAAKRFQEFGEVRHKTAPSIPQLIIADEKEVAIVPVEDNSRESQQASLMWTNSPVFASIMRQFFDYEWSTALDFRSRAREVEMATPALV
jgi:hypothetical protein